MPGTSLGIFWIDMLCKPVFKGLLKCPELAIFFLVVVYGCVAYSCLKSAYLEGL